MRNLFLSMFFLSTLVSCTISGVEQNNTVDELDSLVESTLGNNTDKLAEEANKDIVESREAKDTLRLENGIVITYFRKGTGNTLQKGDVIKLDFSAKLEDGTVFDGNQYIKKEWIPFLVGWQQQTKGWDLALEYLRIGDEVEVFIPSKLARGEKGIPGLVPPNSNNVVSMKIIDRLKVLKEGDGITIWKYDEYVNPGDSVGFGDEVYINYWVSSESKPRYDNSYKRNEPFKLVMGDGNIVPGLYKALYFGREGDRLFIVVPPEEAFGERGLHGLVGPNEKIFYDLQITKVVKKTNH